MPQYEWSCHACDASNRSGDEACSKCSCPAHATAFEIDRYKIRDVVSSQKEKAKEFKEVTSPLGASAWFAISLCFLGGSAYQVVRLDWFPFFPIQIDGAFGFLEIFFGRNAGLYGSAALAFLLGALAFFLGCVDIRSKKLSKGKQNDSSPIEKSV